MVVIVPPNKTAADGMVGVSELVGKHYPANKKVILEIIDIFQNNKFCSSLNIDNFIGHNGTWFL
jgi:hypothetical protein